MEELVKKILAECLADGEPVTREEAEEMAKMEINAKQIKNYVQATPQKKPRKAREKKTDDVKAALLDLIITGLANGGINATRIANGKLEFSYDGIAYSVNLVRHRAK